jgi:hypothetical protein
MAVLSTLGAPARIHVLRHLDIGNLSHCQTLRRVTGAAQANPGPNGEDNRCLVNACRKFGLAAHFPDQAVHLVHVETEDKLFPRGVLRSDVLLRHCRQRRKVAAKTLPGFSQRKLT